MRKKPVDLDPVVQADVRRFLSYGWKNRIVIALIRRKHGVELSSSTLNTLRQSCPRGTTPNSPPPL